ncbi:CocE/NonD family hydrolase [Rhodobacter ferrooxidans]|uniref:Peptidase S15 n=1 Tax=Rhodobacter ferrooxidans TaxID=371731 RepID=C8RYB7_9RHOB|nr:CocE/NonD family hydrolase [Rhodobacter sp. SW2]EEW26105.1 peptidase S15 [Rhodobacter sp. SW2]
MAVRTAFAHSIVEHEDMGIVMSDGCRLSARVWMPVDAGENPVPAVLEYIPYRKRDGTLPRDELMHPYVAGYGYACVRVDMRGNGDSEGLMDDEYTALELADACAVIGWLAAQPWCSGSVGMMGKSWGGFNCLQTAALRPPALRAVISVCSTTDRFADDIHFKGGCLLNENLGWGAVMLSYSSRPADPVLRADWRADWLKRLEAQPFLAPRWAGHQARDGYWKHGSICEDWAAVQVPVLSIGGWADNYMNTVGHLLEHQQSPVQGIIGPWVHQYPHTAVPGPAIGFLQLAVRWWDRWLKGIANGAENDPALRAYMLHSAPPDASAAHRAGHWLTEAEWPSSRVQRRVMPLSAGGVLGGEGGSLAVKVKTPQHLGLHTGEFFPMGLNAEMPGDQAADDALSVCFDTAPLDAALDLLGAARLSLRLTCDQPFAFVVARLCDVAPDGKSVRICHGMLNLRHRDSMEAPIPVPVGAAFGASFDLDLTGYRLVPGHRLRLALSTTYWPFVWPSPKAATLTLLSGALDLPVHRGSDAEWTPPEPEAAAPWKHRVLRQGKAVRRIETDLITGRVALLVEDDGGTVENLTHGLITGETMAERWRIHPDDPTQAHAEIRWTQSLARGAWSVRTEAEAEMRASGDSLTLTARLRAWEGEALVFDRNFAEQVRRDHI